MSHVEYVNMDDTEPIQPIRTRTYLKRWYFLCILSLHNCVFNAVWAEWGTIAQSSKAVFDWTDSTIDMMVNYGNIGTAIATIPIAWLVDVKGLRLSVIASITVTTAGLGLRCLPASTNAHTVYLPSSYCDVIKFYGYRHAIQGNIRLIAIGQFLNGAGGVISSVAPTVLSETWFPPTERNTATCVTLLFAPIGAAIAFVVGPAVVPEPKYQNITVNNSNAGDFVNVSVFTNSSIIKRNIRYINVIEFCIAVILLVLVVIHFPSKPDFPPSKTASIKRLSFINGIRALLRKSVFWHITLTFAIPMGVFGIWITVLDVILNPFGVSQSEAGRLSFYGNLGGVIIGFILSRFSDILLRRTKAIMIPGFAAAVTMFIFFLLTIQDVIKTEKVVLDSLCVGGSSLVLGLAPLYFELACECSYPVSEGTSAAILSLCMNLSGVVFVLITLIHGLGNGWKTWAMISCFILTIVSLAFLRTKYNRIDIDVSSDLNNEINTVDDKKVDQA